MPPRTNQSVVWTMVTLLDDDNFVLCNLCDSKIRRGGENKEKFGTTNIIRHLKCHHRAAYIEELKKNEKKKKKRLRYNHT